jgi:polyisoprenoid-binding protein YceI
MTSLGVFITRPLIASVAASLLLTLPGLAAAEDDPASMPAGTYVLDPHHASVIGSVSHFGRSTYVFRFDASYSYDPTAPDAAAINVNIDVNSLDTGWDKADKEFAQDFAGAAKTPVATFVSTHIDHSGASGTVTGDFTLNGVTKPLSFNVMFNGHGPLGPMGIMGKKAGFTATGTIKRSDFGLSRYVPMVGDLVTLQINAEFVPKK